MWSICFRCSEYYAASRSGERKDFTTSEAYEIWIGGEAASIPLGIGLSRMTND
jgi:hypothetical protein